jgi:hypothetical protein
MNDHAVVNWLYTTCAKSVFDNVYKLDASAFSVWCAIETREPVPRQRDEARCVPGG